jgi:hypothetical protein
VILRGRTALCPLFIILGCFKPNCFLGAERNSLTTEAFPVSETCFKNVQQCPTLTRYNQKQTCNNANPCMTTTISTGAVSRRLLITATVVRARGKSNGSVLERAELRQIFSEYFSFPCQSFIPLTAPQSLRSVIRCWYNRPVNGRSNSGLGFA